MRKSILNLAKKGSSLFDIDRFLWTDDSWAKSCRDDVQRIYREKFAILSLLRPFSVCEIGVRAGYFAACALSASASVYFGYDATDEWGGAQGAVEFAEVSLPEMFPEARIKMTHLDTQSVRKLDCGNVELVHVDGDHTEQGALHDLELALKVATKWILVDDIVHHADTVLIAARRFCSFHQLRYVDLPTLRGDCLIQIWEY